MSFHMRIGETNSRHSRALAAQTAVPAGFYAFDYGFTIASRRRDIPLPDITKFRFRHAAHR
jgi:hypothetical protein